MIILASSSLTRAKILKNAEIDFKQISANFDESIVKKQNPWSYSYEVAMAKKEQFFKIYDLKNVLFADSSVICENEILGKAENDEVAEKMLNLQSENLVSVVTSMIFIGENFTFSNISVASFEFLKFPADEIKKYIESGDYKGKAGAMMIEGFNKKFIKSQKGFTSTAMGLSVEILKRYLW